MFASGRRKLQWLIAANLHRHGRIYRRIQMLEAARPQHALHIRRLGSNVPRDEAIRPREGVLGGVTLLRHAGKLRVLEGKSSEFSTLSDFAPVPWRHGC